MRRFRLSNCARAGFLSGLGWGGLSLLLIVGCKKTGPESLKQAAPVVPVETRETKETGETSVTEHGHVPGVHGGIMVSLGRDSHHLEAVFEQGGKLRVYTLGADETRVIDVEAKDWSAFVKRQGDERALPMVLSPEPQDGDAEGRASLFVGQLPAELAGEPVQVTISPIVIDGERFRASFASSDGETAHEGAMHGDADAVSMPDKIAESAEANLYLTPGGLYTLEDIEANGRVTASQKFAGIRSAHDMKPKVGDRICPVTQTKANPAFEWVIGGQRYLFCCPPCVDEFLKQAKEDPESIAPAESFVKQESANEG